MKIAVLTPLPPTRSGVAHYASMLLPALAARAEVRAFESLDGYRRTDFDHVVYQLGNNPFHEVAYREALREPGVAVLHDLVLHHLVVEMTLARGDVEGYVAALRASHGAAGEAWARARAAGLHAEIANFLFPASLEVANRSRAVIVHNRYAADRLASFGVETPIHVVPHPYVPEARRFDREAIRTRLGFAASHRVIGFFGFLTSAKRGEVVLEAFQKARERDPALALLIVGEPAPNIDRSLLDGPGIVATGYVDDVDFPSYYAAADRLVNLRYPTAGETSGTLIRALDSGKPVAVSDYAQFAELPESCVVRIPLGKDELERLVAFFLDDLPDPSAAQRAWLESHATLEATADGYLRAMAGGEPPARTAPRADATLAVFPTLELLDARVEGRRITLDVLNRGETVLQTRTYGRPEYRLIASTFSSGAHVQDRWLALPGDLGPGQRTSVEMEAFGAPDEVRLRHALQDVPAVDPAEWARAELRRVR